MSQFEISFNLDETHWNQFIKEHGEWNFFQSLDWGEVQKKQGVEVIRLAALKAQEIVAVAQIFLVRAKRGTFLHVRQGPVFKADFSSDIPLWKLLLTELRKLSQKNNCWHIRIGPMLPNSREIQSFLADLGFKPAPIHAMDGEYAWVLDIRPSEDELLFNMRKTTKYLIRQAIKLGVTVETSTNIEDFLKLYKLTSERHGFVPHIGLVDEFRVFSQKNSCELLVAKHENQILSGAIIIYFGSQAIYHHGASVTSKIPASYLLQWEAIRRAKKRGLKLYNFWGIAPNDKPNHPWKGITLFKTGFGGQVKEFIHAHDLPTSHLYGISYSIELARKIQKGY